MILNKYKLPRKKKKVWNKRLDYIIPALAQELIVNGGHLNYNDKEGIMMLAHKIGLTKSDLVNMKRMKEAYDIKNGYETTPGTN